MKIALPTKTSGEKSFVSEHFGRANFFYIYDTDKEVGEVYINQNKDGQGGVGIKSSELVLNHQVDVLITPRVGEKALRVLKEGKISLFQANEKIVKENIKSYLNGELKELL